MSDQDEQLYGRAQTEREQGYTPLVHSVPDEPAEPAIDSDSAIAQHLNRPAPPEPVERAYHDTHTGKPRADNETVELERAARDISEIRAAEALELSKQRNAELNEAMDWLAREEAAQRAAATPQHEQQPQAQPEHLDPEAIAAMPLEQQNALYAANQAQLAEADRQIQEFLKNPEVRERIEGEFNQVRAEVDQAKGQYQAATAQLALEASGMITALYPELAGLNAQQLQGAVHAMAQSQPERVQQLVQLAGRAQNIIATHQQQQQQVAQQQQELNATRFKQFAVASDHRFDSLNAHVPAETMKAIKTEAVTMLKEYGLSEADLAREYNSNPLFRSAAGQQIIADAARFRLSQKGLSRHLANPVPHVVRPGSSAERVTRTEEALASAQAKLKPSMSAREAAQYIIARRAAR